MRRAALGVIAMASLLACLAGGVWLVYNTYQSDMISHYDRLQKLIDTYAKAYA